jgi:hypothetical protein
MVAHINEHYSQALQQGVKKDSLAEVAEFVKKAGPEIAKLKAIDQQAAQLAQAHDQMAAEQQQQQGAAGSPQQPPPGAPQ